MTFDDLVSPADVFLDANTFIYHFTSDHRGLIHLASKDDDFDRVPGLNRYAPG